MKYNWQQKDWTKFTYNNDVISEYLYVFTEKAGLSKGALSVLTKDQHNQTLIDALVSEAIKTSEIEGEFISRKDVLSSVKNNIGLSSDTTNIRDVRAKGIASMVVEVHHTFRSKLTEEMLFDWHRMIFFKKTRTTVGEWRKHSEPMQVISGRHGKEIIHFEAPPSKVVPKEMGTFIKWFNNTAPGAKDEIKFAPIRSAIAHIYFESIHPFEDGNGRIGRAIAEKALLQSLGYPLLLSLSTSIEENRNEYYNSLKNGQRSNEITAWLIYFIETILKSLDTSEKLINFTLKKARLFDAFKEQINERQEKVLKKMFEAGLDGYKGGMTARKYMQITKVSKSTATREMQKLRDLDIFKSIGKGRSTSYTINIVDK